MTDPRITLSIPRFFLLFAMALFCAGCRSGAVKAPDKKEERATTFHSLELDHGITVVQETDGSLNFKEVDR